MLITKALKHSITAAMALCVISLISPLKASAEEWRIATLAPDGSSWMKVLSKGAAGVDKITASRVQFKYYTSGSQGDEKDVVRKMNSGGLDGAALTSVGLSLIDPSIRVLELPMLFKSEAELDYVRKKMWPTFKKRFEKKGYFLGDPGDVGFIYFYSNNAIKSVKDLQSAKVWQWSDDSIVKEMYKNLGVNGVPLGVPEVLPALKTGRINATYGSPIAVNAFQWHSKVKFSTSMPMSYGIGATVIKLDKWNGMNDDDKKNVKKVLRAQSKTLRKTIRKDNKKAAKAIARMGVQSIETPAAMVQTVTQSAEKVWSKMTGKLYSKGDLEKVLKFRAEFRAK